MYIFVQCELQSHEMNMNNDGDRKRYLSLVANGLPMTTRYPYMDKQYNDV